jgi:hypothetical protein
MIASAASFTGSLSTADLHTGFLPLLPKIVTHARITFRRDRCRARKEEAIQECVSLAWKWYISLSERGKDVTQFPMVFVYLVVKAVRCGRRFCGQEKAHDVLSSQAQRRHGFTVESLPISTRTAFEDLYAAPHGQRHLDAFEERLQDNTQTPVPDQVQFRIDFPAWLQTLTARERRLIRAMAQNERTKDLSRRFEVSAARISQLRREFELGWTSYCDDGEEDMATACLPR